MAIIKPFKAIRPIPELAAKVASLPYDVMSSREAREMVNGNPDSFLHVEKAEIDLDATLDLHDQRVYAKARANLQRMIADGILVQDSANCFYIYREVLGAKMQTGLVGCVSIDDYAAGVIKIHEQTRPTQEQDRLKYIDYCDAHTGLVFLTYRSQQAINLRIETWISTHAAVYDFTAEDGVQHLVWVIDDRETIHTFIHLFEAIDFLYVADGHHRSAAAFKIGMQRRAQTPDYTGAEEFNYFLAGLFQSDQLSILNYNRVVKDLYGLSEAEFLKRVGEHFDIECSRAEGPYQPVERHTFGMYVGDRWYILTPRPGTYSAADPIAALDVSILQNNLLTPILGIQDPRTDERIDFVGGIRGLRELERRVQGGMKVAFSMYPTTIAEVLAVADMGKIMPPKSTWFEPKLRSGLFVHRLS